MLMRITWLGHSSVKIQTGSDTIYIDPYAGENEWYTPATIVLISKFHFDHCNMEKVRKISTDETLRIGTKETAKNLFPCSVLVPGQSILHGDVEIVGTKVINPHSDVARHGVEEEGMGFVVIAEKKKVFFMGDSDYYPALGEIRPDVLFVSVGGTFTSEAKEAASIANAIGPKLAIPIHWGAMTGSKDSAELFSELAKVSVRILDQGESVDV